ncbi:MAG: hypothetical protein R3A44_06350 [Caldilineaceae bacterium]
MLMTQMGVRTLLTSNESDPVNFLNVLNRTLYHNVQRMEIDKTSRWRCSTTRPTASRVGVNCA